MNILFIDDTEQLNKQYIGVGGVIFHDDTLTNLCALFKGKKELHGIPAEIEIKWSPPKGSWLGLNLINENRIIAYSDFLNLVSYFDGKVIVSVMKKDGLNQSTTGAKWKCIEFVTERFQFFLQEQTDRNGLIIADFPSNDKEDRELLDKYYQLLEEGTHYVKPKNIVMNLLTTKSHLNPALQLADLIVGITTAMCTTRQDYALPYWETVKRNFHANQNGQVMGCGLKIYPKEIIGGILPTLFPEVIIESENEEESYKEYNDRMRYSYSVLLSEEELDLYFPRS